MNVVPNHVWSPGLTLEHMEKMTILAALSFYHGNKTQTALALGIALRTLDYKLAKYRGETVEKKETENGEI